ncbi:hypothetical protein ABVT39_005502 [Epinephelus coioides]
MNPATSGVSMSLADQQQWCPTSVQVTVQQARGLRTKGKSGTNDAYALMQVGKEKFQTSVVEKCVAPVWKEEAAFDLPGGGGGGGGTERCVLHVHVLHRALVGPDKLLGQAVINLLQLSEDKTRNKTEWFKLLDKTGKADKDRGEVLVNIQFMRNNMTASMFDLSAAGKSRSRLGKFKDKVRGKKKESDTASNVVPSLTQVLTDSEGEENEDGEVAEGKDEKKKKHKMKSLFSPKSNLQKNMSQSMSVLPAKNSSLNGSQSSGLNVDSSEGKKKFKFKIHKRSGSSGNKDSPSGHQKQGTVEQSNLCINGSHVYCEEPPPRTSRIGSNFSIASSGHGSMEDVPESSPPSVDSLRGVRQYSPWTEEEEENIKEDVGELRGEEEEMIMMEEERRRKEEEEERARRQEEELAEEKRRQEEQEEKVRKEEEERIRMEEEERALEEKRRQEEKERVRIEELERERLAEEKRRQEELERRRIEEEERAQEERRRQEEQERRRIEEEERAQEERRRQEEEERLRREEEERERLREEKRKQEEQEKRRIEEVKRQREEEERVQEERRRQEEDERLRREEEERERLREEKKRLEEQERRRIEEEKMQREEEERAQEERRRQEEEERLRREEEERERLEKEKRRLEEQERRIEEERIRKEEEEKAEEEKRRRHEEEEMVRRLELKRRLEEQEKRQREEEERIRMEEERAQEERRRQEEEELKLAEEKRRQEEEKRRKEEEEERAEEEKRSREEEMMRRQEEEREEKRRLEEQERRRREEEERIKKEEEERARREKEEFERLVEEKRKQEEEERKRIEAEEKTRREEEERIRLEEERRRKEEEERERLAEEKRKLEEQERRRIEEEEKRRREEEERIRKEEERRQEEEERARKEKEEHERLVEEKKRQDEQERKRMEEEERIRREKEAEKEKREEEARKLEKEKSTKDAGEQKENKTKPKAPGRKPNVAERSPARVTSTNPFDEDFSDPSQEILESPDGPDSSTAKVSTAQQRIQSAASSVRSNPVFTDEKNPISTQREKRLAPRPPGSNQAERQSQREQDASTRHLAQINKQSKDKDVKTVSVLPQRLVQMIAPLSRSPTDAKNTQSLTQSSTTRGTSNAAKHNKRPAPSRPHSAEEEPPSEHKTAPSSDGNISNKCASEAKQAPIVYGLNPFEDDEDENAAQVDTTSSGNTASVQWPPAVSQAADKDAASHAKIKSSKTRAPPVPELKAATLSTSVGQNTDRGHVTDETGVTEPDSSSHDPETVNPTSDQDASPQESQPATVQSAGEEAGGKKEGPPVASRRLQPVKPLNPLEQQSVSAIQGEKENKSTEILCEVQEKTKVNGTELKGPFSQLTQEELISLVIKQETQLADRDKKISDLEKYIDNLLVRVMEENPTILMSLNAMK